MGDTLPAAGYVSDSGRTTLEMKNHQESLVSIMKRIPGIGESIETSQISTGSIAPTSGLIEVRTEGDVPLDALDTINIGGYADGSAIILTAFSGQLVDLTDAAGGSGQS